MSFSILRLDAKMSEDKENNGLSEPDDEQVELLYEGAAAWNKWRESHPDVKPNLFGAALDELDLRRANLKGAFLSTASLEDADLRGADLSDALLIEANFKGANLEKANLSGSNLNHADLSEANLRHALLVDSGLVEANLEGADLAESNSQGATFAESILISTDLSGANLQGACLSGVTLGWATLRNANLSNVDCNGAYFNDADLSGARLTGANLIGAMFSGANLGGADLQGANLSRCSLVSTQLQGANLSGCIVFGIAAWKLMLKDTVQADLIITDEGEPVVTVDNLEIAQFVYLLLHNEKVRDLINTITSKVVLILGRFTPERKRVLDAIRTALRARGYVPIVFDFTPSAKRDLTETVLLLANMSKFIIADLTDAKSIPQELSHIVPFLPSVPVQPIVLASQRTYAMYEHWESYQWVLTDFPYNDERDLLEHIDDKIIRPAESRGNEQTEIVALREQVRTLKEKLGDKEAGGLREE